jgi:hypothetical protein
MSEREVKVANGIGANYGVALSMSQFASFEDYQAAVTAAMAAKQKPVVTYEGDAVVGEWLNTGIQVAYLKNIEGHNSYWLNGGDVRTSVILSHDVATGRIETLNTVYVPR